jgi:hypothetical protein
MARSEQPIARSRSRPSHGPKSLRAFVTRAGTITAAAVGLGSGILQFRGSLSWTLILIIALAVFACSGWIAAVYVAYSSQFVLSPVEKLLAAISENIRELPFADSWLRATLLNQRAVDAYWHCNKTLKIQKFSMSSIITERDVTNTVHIDGRSESKADVDSCPMVLIGGSVLHFDQFPKMSTVAITDSGEQTLKMRAVFDAGEFHLAEIVFPTMIHRHETFHLLHCHEWPGAMTPGADVMWYPYAAMFERETDVLDIEVSFPTDVRFIRGYTCSVTDGTCEVTSQQPAAVPDSPRTYRWVLNSVSNAEIYALVFER